MVLKSVGQNSSLFRPAISTFLHLDEDLYIASLQG